MSKSRSSKSEAIFWERERKAERQSKWFMVEIDGKPWTSLTVVGKLVGQEIGG